LERRDIPRLTNRVRIWRTYFFFDLVARTTKRFDSLFSDEGGDEEGSDDGDRQGNQGTSIANHFGWLYILRNLDTRKLLDITGEKSVMNLNIIFVFNWMSMEKDVQAEEVRRQRQQQMMNRTR
tara:strand:- start:6197 stop:6565 length:369 start_codon:yes stop_codon:yes gene_type:complete